MSLMERVELCKPDCRVCLLNQPGIERPAWHPYPLHGWSGWKLGCRCPDCERGKNEERTRATRVRRWKRLEGVPREQWHYCNLCGGPFPSAQSRGSHETRCDD